MTKRAVIITTSVMVSIIAVFTILFGVVFRMRDIDLKYSQDFGYSAQISDIKECCGLRKNTGIFSVDRDKIASNIEREFPYVKAQVGITGFTKVTITLSNRMPLYYLVEEARYYILDEDCKVLEVTTTAEKATDYIRLNNVFSVGENVVAGDFLSGKYATQCRNLYNALYTSAMLNLDNGEGGFEDRYLNRVDMCEVITSLKFTQVEELKGTVDKLIMTTSYGTNIAIIDPVESLELKVNMAFSALRTLIAKDKTEGTDLATKGTINVRYTYDDNNHYQPKCEYLANS